MILDRTETIEKLKEAYKNCTVERGITSDNLDEIILITDGEYVAVENEHGTTFPLEDLSDGELLLFCTEHRVKPVYDVYKSIIKIKEYLISEIGKFEFEDSDGNMSAYILDPDDCGRNGTYRVKRIKDGDVTIEVYDELCTYTLNSFSIEDLLSILELKSGFNQ